MRRHHGEQLKHHTNDNEHPHHHAESCCHQHTHHPGSRAGGSELSAGEKLIVRLEHALRHNSEHAAFYEKLAEEAGELGGDALAEEIREVARFAHRQNEVLESVLASLQSR